MKISPIRAFERILGNPFLALTVATVVMLVWHVPPIYDITLENETVHIIEHITFMISGTMLWWSVFKPIPEGRLKPLTAVVYLAVAGFLASILGMIYTMSDVPFYAAYVNPDDHHNLLPLIREQWGLTHWKTRAWWRNHVGYLYAHLFLGVDGSNDRMVEGRGGQ